jgi:DNA-binding HxlR family transcriptional regulator
MGSSRRRYSCPVELTVDVIAGRWTPVILARLKEGTHRYGQLRRLIPGLSEKMLTQRLRELEAAGLIERRVHTELPEHPAPVSYRLTEDGRSLSPVLQAMYDWGRTRAAAKGIAIGEPA